MGKKVLLIDGTSLVYRAYFAFIKNPLRNSRGENTSAAFAFTNSLLKLLREIEPDYVALVFDSKAPTFRHEKFKEYKATRPRMPDDLSAQLGWVREIGEGLGFPIVEVPGFEADDVLAKLALEAKEKGYEVIVVTSDKDLLQLVDDSIKILDTRPKEETLYTRERVIEKMGVPPERIVDFIALMGDAIDNIPGVPGIGPKTARELISEFGTIENIYRNLSKIKRTSLRKTLEKYRESAFLSKELAKLNLDVPIHFDLEQMRRKEMLRSKLYKIFKRLEFASLMVEMAEYPRDIEKLEGLPDKMTDGISFHLYGNEIYVGVSSRETYRGKVDNTSALKKIENKGVFSYKDEFRKSLSANIELGDVTFDLMLACYLLEPGKPRYDVDFIAIESMGYRLHETYPDRGHEIVSIVASLRDEIEKELKEKELYELYRKIELPLARVLALMEHRGVLVDPNVLREMDRELQREILKLEEEIYSLAGGRFNINSPKQLSYILFDKLKLPPVKKTKTGYSTDYEVLIKLAKDYELPKKLLEYRELFKIRSSYVSSLLEAIDPRTGRIHPTFNQTGTATGRLACQNPNLQTVPIRTETGRKIRRAFIAPRGYLLLSSDYSQIELRILAHVTGDENLIDAFKRGEDIHTSTASFLWDKPKEEVSFEERRKAKVVNFGITYGMSPFGLSKELDITREEAASIIERYFSTYPKVKQWIEKTLREAREKGYVTTILGRRRYIPEFLGETRSSREFAERIAINAPIQGSAADLIKKAMVDIQNEIEKRNFDAHLLLQIHDELLFEVKEEELDEFKEMVREKMEEALKLRVPLKVEMGWGKDWLNAHPL